MLELAGDVASAGTALGALLLVFIGATVSSFESYDKQAQSVVRGRYRARGWMALAGFLLALLSCLSALVGKWVANEYLAMLAFGSLAASLLIVAVTALLTVLAIK